MSKFDQSIAKFGWLTNICTISSLGMCFGETVLIAGITLTGIMATDMAVHLQAVLMWSLALLANVGLLIDRKHHSRKEPILLGVVGLVVMIGTLYLYYDWRILFLAYLCIISAIFFNSTFALKSLNLTIQKQATELHDLNSMLEDRVANQVADIERLSRLKRFLSPQVVELVTETGDESFLKSHRQFISVLFCDLRGFTAFSEKIEPEEAMNVLQSYHEAMGKLVSEFKGTIDHRAGDGLMVFFNDPLPCDEPIIQSIKMAFKMRERAEGLVGTWRKRNYELGFGIGIACGYATLGMVGYEGRFDYTANGNVVNLASRLCDKAKHGDILINHSTYTEIEGLIEIDGQIELKLKGINEYVTAYRVAAIT